MARAPIHIPCEAYRELNSEIAAIIAEEDESNSRSIDLEYVIDEWYTLVLKVVIYAQVTRSRFTDDAWGATQTFTETNWHCNCEITKVQVLDGKGKERESDFDESKLELEFETTDWK